MHFSTLPHADHPIVELRPIESRDLGAWAAYLTLPVVYEHTSWNIASADELTPHVWSESSLSSDGSLRFAIVKKSNDHLVGTIGFHSVSAVNRSAELGYELAPDMWGKEIASYLCARMVAWAHQQACIVRVQAVVLPSNRRSQAVLERCGFLQEGLLRCYRAVRGVPSDYLAYSHIDREASPV